MSDLPSRQEGTSLQPENPFQISEAAIRSQIAFFHLTPRDNKNLHKIQSCLQEHVTDIVEAFYRHLTQVPELAQFLSDSEIIARLKQTQTRYLLTLGQHYEQSDYWEDRIRIGLAHERIGLHPKWYLGAYGILFELVAERLVSQYRDPDALASMLVTLQKFFTLDIALGMESYHALATQRLEQLLAQVEEAQHRLQEASRLDTLTQVLNRKFLMEALEMEFHRSQRFGHPLTLLFIDIDHFKRLNDEHGHTAGDQALQQVSDLIQKSVRPADIVGRYGGEEFVVGLVECHAEMGPLIAERIRLKIALTPLTIDTQTLALTVSIGCASMTSDTPNLDELLKKSDRALYLAKATGRNQVAALV
ncbi:MAG: diguanylate cyclase [Nitrospirae bacterium]|nr:MAG: diguanylate cyclase [Nitrospirota bacterium]